MKAAAYIIQSILFTAVFTLTVIAQTGSKTSAKVDLQKAFQETVKTYEAFEVEHGHYLQTPNVKMHYLTFGNATGRPMVWVHGTGSNCYEVTPFADSLVKNGFYLIAIDYYGHGKTPFPTKEVSIYNVADDIYVLLNQLNIRKTLIGGWSRGGSIVTAFYDRYPERVEGIVLEDGGSVGWGRPYYKLEQKEMLQRLKEEAEKYGPIPPQKLFPSLFDAFCYYQSNGALSLDMFHSLNKSSTGQWGWNPDLFEWLGEDSWETITNYILRPTEAPLFEYSTTVLEPKIVYRNLQVPLLIFDPVDSTDLLKDFEQENTRLTQQHPGLITHLVYENTGHAVKFQHPQRFLRDLLAFLAKVKAQPRRLRKKK